jgi:hypothetical protein
MGVGAWSGDEGRGVGRASGLARSQAEAFATETVRVADRLAIASESRNARAELSHSKSYRS